MMESSSSAAAPSSSSTNKTSAAVESAVDAFATRVLTDASPAEAYVDESLGPYVTSLLRCSAVLHEETDDDDVANIPEFDSLLELLAEHCHLNQESATIALTTIANAVRTGVAPLDNERYWHTSTCSSLDDDGTRTAMENNSYHILDPSTLFSVAANAADGNPPAADEFPPLSDAQQDRDETLEKKGRTPLKEDRLIPVDLLGALDDPLTPPAAPAARRSSNQAAVMASGIDDEGFPPLASSTTTAPKKNGTSSNSGSSTTKGKKTSKKKGEDLTAVLFRSTRVRQSSIDSDNVSRPTVSANSAPCRSSSTPEAQQQQQQLYRSQSSQYFQQQCEMAVEMLLSMNPELSTEAATEAALMANADANLAQYVINHALQAPPVCRHLLGGGCYRSDCQFSHDVEGYTCLFWIRGRCGKGSSCRFLHGFSDRVLEEVHEMMSGSSTLSTDGVSSNAPVAIETGNLVSHNMNAAFSASHYDSSPFSSFQPDSHSSHSSGFDAGLLSMMSPRAEPSALETRVQTLQVDTPERAPTNEGSFAWIASKGYDSGASFAHTETSNHSHGSNINPQTERTVVIPQELWNPHINRDSHMFHIQDPIERYKAVSAASSKGRADVLDLHFQSTKTFPVVLSNVLPRKLEEHDEVWVVTGTGHHVSRSTHQRGGGALESAVLSWLSHEGYDYVRGRDRNGHGGAVLVKRLRNDKGLSYRPSRLV